MAGNAWLRCRPHQRCRLPQLCRALSPALPAAPRGRSAPWLVGYWPSAAAGEQPIVADAVEPLGQDVKQETPDELVGGERHPAIACPPVAAVILVAEGDAAVVESEEAAVRDRDAVGVTGEIGEHRLRPGEGRLGVDEPVLPPQRCEMGGEGPPIA